MTILNKKAFALVALLMTSVCVQAVPGDNDAKKSHLANAKAFVYQRATKRAGIAIIGCAAAVAVVVAAISYHRAQQAAKPVEPAAESAVELAV